ncbi:hypothetical protein SKAU_G00016330 [Synaphobranchus kaupii]|uniref:Uncharacterized protein n=1 Tax=Synaphobranchus kaupii TaxID=118154 RepID=A0A9Q1GAZ8_SYNKA|nr:hypothetical protein SKAU_G00016330 [Synaphobranchus kaupii]
MHTLLKQGLHLKFCHPVFRSNGNAAVMLRSIMHRHAGLQSAVSAGTIRIQYQIVGRIHAQWNSVLASLAALQLHLQHVSQELSFSKEQKKAISFTLGSVKPFLCRDLIPAMA